jgi:ParB-like chromosome segregation protein Spo0J
VELEGRKEGRKEGMTKREQNKKRKTKAAKDWLGCGWQVAGGGEGAMAFGEDVGGGREGRT